MARWALRSSFSAIFVCAVASSFISADGDLATKRDEIDLGLAGEGSCSADDAQCRANSTGAATIAATYSDCESCVAGGFGWSPVQAKCGGFSNRLCWVGALPEPGELPDLSQIATCDKCVSTGFGWDEQLGECGFHATTDCAAEGYAPARVDFSQYDDCHSCVAAGYGWCRIKQRCGGYASRSCIGLEKPPAALSSKPAAADFGAFSDCASCVGAGYGWCPMKRKCGGFANRVCGTGEAYASSPAADYTDCISCIGGGFGWDPHRQRCGKFRNTDCSSENPDFSRYTTCEKCTNDGWGWCPILRKCGGFANKDCTGKAHAAQAQVAEPLELAPDPAPVIVHRKFLEEQIVAVHQARAHGQVAELTMESFDELVGKHHMLLFFYTNWCGAKCDRFLAEYEAIAKKAQHLDSFVVAKVNADYAADLVPRFEVHNYPVLLYFRNGQSDVTEQFQARNLDAAKLAELLSRESPKSEL